MDTQTKKRKSKRQKKSTADIVESSSAISAKDIINQPQLNWPTYTAPKQLFKNSVLSGRDENLWYALAHVEPTILRENSQFVAMRYALHELGLGWVSFNRYNGVYVISQPYKMAKQFYESNGWISPQNLHDVPLQKIQVEDRQWISRSNGESALVINGTKFTNNDGYLQFSIIKKSQSIFPDVVIQHIHTSIMETGMIVIRGAVDKATIEQLQSDDAIDNSHPDAAKLKFAKDRTPLRDTSGSGASGDKVFTRRVGKTGKTEDIGSFYSDICQSTYLDKLQKNILNSLKVEGKREPGDKKYIYLRYSKGGENWAHRDNNADKVFPYQALVMLSSSDDYDGGEFYVAKQVNIDDKISIVRTCCPKLDSGDMIIFQAGKDGNYDHGMKTVTRGERIAVGLLQPR